MKKTIIILLISLMGMVANAETYFFMRLTTTDNSIVTYSLDSLKFIHNNNNVTIINSNGFITQPLDQLQKMQFVQIDKPGTQFADVNGDGEINIADVNSIINAILGNAIEGTFDVNSDGEINIADVNVVINCILGSPH